MSDLKEKLAESAKKAETQKAERTKRAVKGSHLQEKILKAVDDSGLSKDENTAFVKVTGAQKGRKIYIEKKGGRIDLSGFTVQHAAVTQVSEEQAKEKHLGKVRGQVDFSKSDDEVLEAFDLALKAALEPAPAEEPKTKKEKKAAAKPSEETAAPAAQA